MRAHRIAFFACALAGVIGTSAKSVTINNGLAPPNPANVIDAGNSFPAESVQVQNVGCDGMVAFPCVSPGAPTAVAVVSGGTAQSVTVYESSTITMTGGSVTGGIRAFDTASIAISGGSVGALLPVGSGSITVTGGTIAPFSNFLPGGSSSITFLGSGFMVNGMPVGFGLIQDLTGQVSGTLQSGDSFIGNFCHRGGLCTFGGGPGSILIEPIDGSIILAVPEPGTALQLAACLLLLAAASRRGAHGRRRA